MVLVALPLCLGIALDSGAPFFSGIISGIIGGIVIGCLSKSHLSVSEPAAESDLNRNHVFMMCITYQFVRAFAFKKRKKKLATTRTKPTGEAIKPIITNFDQIKN